MSTEKIEFKDEKLEKERKIRLTDKKDYDKLQHLLFDTRRLLSREEEYSAVLRGRIRERDRIIKSLENIIASICKTQIKPKGD